MKVFTCSHSSKETTLLAQNGRSLKNTSDCAETAKFTIPLDLRAHLTDLTWSKHLIRNKIYSKFSLQIVALTFLKHLSVGRPAVCSRGVMMIWELPKVKSDAIKSLKLHCYGDQGTFGKLKRKLNLLSSEYDLSMADWLDFLWLSLGEVGCFLNGCFERCTREKERKRENIVLSKLRDVFSR